MFWVYLIIFSGLVFGFYGVFGSVFGFLCSKLKKDIQIPDLFLKKIKNEEKNFSKIEIKPIEDILTILNYEQILIGNDTKLKVNLISMLSFNPIRENVKLIKIAIYDRDEMVRILAANALQKMDDYYVNIISKLEEKLKYEKTWENFFKLASLYDEYIYSTLLPEDLIDFYTEKMFKYFEKAYNLSNKKEQISERYIRACIRFNKLEKAKKLLKEHLKMYPESISAKLWYCDFLLKEGKYEEIMNNLKTINEEEIKKIPKLYKAYKWWLYSNEQN